MSRAGRWGGAATPAVPLVFRMRATLSMLSVSRAAAKPSYKVRDCFRAPVLPAGDVAEQPPGSGFGYRVSQRRVHGGTDVTKLPRSTQSRQ
jgi:hypothetical protein